MFEIAVRIRELTSSNLNNLVDRATNPEKMLKLLRLELEEAIIALSKDAAGAERAARDAVAKAGAHDDAATDWQAKAKLALANNRDDLARAALGEKDSASTAAADLRRAAKASEAECVELRRAAAELETKLAETRERLSAMSVATGGAAKPASASSKAASRAAATADRIAVLEKRIDFAEAGANTETKAAALDQELAAMQREAKLDADLAALKKGLKKGK